MSARDRGGYGVDDGEEEETDRRTTGGGSVPGAPDNGGASDPSTPDPDPPDDDGGSSSNGGSSGPTGGGSVPGAPDDGGSSDPSTPDPAPPDDDGGIDPNDPRDAPSASPPSSSDPDPPDDGGGIDPNDPRDAPSASPPDSSGPSDPPATDANGGSRDQPTGGGRRDGPGIPDRRRRELASDEEVRETVRDRAAEDLDASRDELVVTGFERRDGELIPEVSRDPSADPVERVPQDFRDQVRRDASNRLGGADLEDTRLFSGDSGTLVGVTASAQRRRAAEDLDEQLPNVDVAPEDVKRTEDGFTVSDRVLEQSAAARRGFVEELSGGVVNTGSRSAPARDAPTEEITLEDLSVSEREALRSAAAEETAGVEADDLRLRQAEDGDIVPVPATSRDLPRASEATDFGGADFREDTFFRSLATDLTEDGRDIGGSAGSQFIDLLGGDASAQRVGQSAGGAIGSAPPGALLLGVEAAQAGDSVIEAGIEEGPLAGVEQGQDLTVDAADAVLRGADRTFDVDFSRRAEGEGAAIQFEEARDEQIAGSLFAAGLLTGASGPTSAAARVGAGRAASAASRASTGARRFIDDSRGQADLTGGQRRQTDAGDEPITIEGDDIRLSPEDRARSADLPDRESDIDPGDAFQRRRDERIRGDREVTDRMERDTAFQQFRERQRNRDRDPILREGVEPAPGEFRFTSGQQTATAAGAATTASADDGPAQPNPGGLLVDEEANIRDANSPTASDERPASTVSDPDEFLTADVVETESGADTTTATVADGVIGVGAEPGSGSSVGSDSSTEPAGAGDVGSRPGQDTGSEGDSATTPAADAAATEPAARGRNQAATQAPAFDLLSRPTATERTPARVEAETRPLVPFRPRSPSPRRRTPDFPEFGAEGSPSQSAAQGRGSGAGNRAEGPLVAGFGAETFTALAVGGFGERTVAEDVTEPAATGELPTQTLANPGEDEEAVEAVDELFFGSVLASEGVDDNAAESDSLLDFGGGDSL